MNAVLTIDTYFDRVFYINLRKDAVRNAHMIAQFQRFGIANFERFEALALQTLPGVEQYRNFNKNHPKYITGQLSCRASHIACMKTIKARKYQRVLILEDDVVFLQDPNVLLRQNENILNDWDMLYFGGLIEPSYRNQIVCTHAYCVRQTVVDDIIHMADASGMEIDNFYAKVLQHMSYNYNQSGRYNIRAIFPFNQIAQDAVFGTNIHA